MDRDCLVVIAFGTFAEVHWWKCRPQCQLQRSRINFDASGGSLTRLFKADLAVDNDKVEFKHYLSFVKRCWETGVDIYPLELKSTG